MARHKERFGTVQCEWDDPTKEEMKEELFYLEEYPELAIRRLLEARKRLEALEGALRKMSVLQMGGAVRATYPKKMAG